MLTLAVIINRIDNNKDNVGYVVITPSHYTILAEEGLREAPPAKILHFLNIVQKTFDTSALVLNT